MSGPPVVPLVCPVCASDLTGLPTDAIFGCAECLTAYVPTHSGLGQPYPIARGPETSGAHLPLPFWALSVDAVGVPAEVPPVTRVYIPAFDMRRRSYFGDPGLAWTLERADVPHDGAVRSLLGATLALADAERLGYYYALRLIDAAVDVTGLRVEMSFSSPTVLVVDFADQGDALVDPVLGTSYPAVAVCDLLALRGAMLLSPAV